MATDPLSIAGGAVGVASLGLTVCRSLISYCDSWKTFDEQIASIWRRADDLKSSLMSLQGLLTKFDSRYEVAVSKVEESLMSCIVCTQELEKMLNICRHKTLPSGMRNAFRKNRQRALFPLREATLKKIQDEVGRLLQNLQISLQILQLDMIQHQRSDLEQILSTSTSTLSLTALLPDDIHSIKSVVVSNRTVLKDVEENTRQTSVNSSAAARMMSAMDERVADLLAQLGSAVDNVPSRIEKTIHEALDQKFPRYNDMRRGSKPENTGTVFEGKASPQEWNHIHAPALRCNCIPRGKTRVCALPSKPSGFFRGRTSAHRPGCPLYHFSGQDTIGLRITFGVVLLRQIVQATMAMTKGAGGYSLSRCDLRIKTLVPYTAPAFALLEQKTVGIRRNPENCLILGEGQFPRYCETVLQELYDLILEGVASANDSTKSGSLLHAAFKLLKMHYYCIPSNRKLSDRELSDLAEGFRCLLGGLLSMGALPSETDQKGWTLLDYLILRVPCEHFGSLVVKLLDQYDLKYSTGSRACGFKAVNGAIDENHNKAFSLPEVLECGSLGSAILEGSEKDVRRILDSLPDSVDERNALGQTPLHLAKDWPTGMRLLLEKGASPDRIDRQLYLPLYYACSYGCATTTDLLLKADSPLYALDEGCVDLFKWSLSNVGNSEIASVAGLLVDAMAERRRRLCNLAIRELPKETSCQLHLQVDEVVDEKATEVHSTLRRHGVDVPPALRVPRGRTTVYHCYSESEKLSCRAADLLFQTGFTDVDGIDQMGRTPLMLFQNLESDYIEWLERHEGNLFLKMPGNSNLLLSCLIAEWISIAHLRDVVGRKPFSPISLKDQRTFVAKSTHLKGELYGSTSSDGCVCPCSPHGCRPITSALKPFSLSRPPMRCPEYVVQMSEQPERLMLHMIKSLFTEPVYQKVWEGKSWLPEAAIRFLTFEKLGIMHVCCCYSRTSKEWHTNEYEEVIEFLEEEAYKIQQLEKLINEFRAKYVELGMPLPEFLELYWTARIEEFLREENPLSSEELSRIKEIGVNNLSQINGPVMTSAGGDLSELNLCPEPFKDLYLCQVKEQ